MSLEPRMNDAEKGAVAMILVLASVADKVDDLPEHEQERARWFVNSLLEAARLFSKQPPEEEEGPAAEMALEIHSQWAKHMHGMEGREWPTTPK